MAELQISKIDAARRQIETAIRLYFAEGDPVSIHTLIAAAYHLIEGLCKHRGEPPPPILKALFDYIKPEARKEFGRIIREAENFFKHADTDPTKSLDFDPAQSQWMILDCCGKYRELTGEQLPLLAVFQSWSMMTWAREFIKDEAYQAMARPAVEYMTQEKMNRKRFYALCLPVFENAMTGRQSD